MEAITNFLNSTGFAKLGENPLQLVMLAVSCVLLYLAIVKKFEPLLLLPIAFGMLLTNLPVQAFTMQSCLKAAMCIGKCLRKVLNSQTVPRSCRSARRPLSRR